MCGCSKRFYQCRKPFPLHCCFFFMHEGSPLIVTLQLDEKSHSFFNSLRTKHFPPEKNFLAAHLTLFHHLPSTETTIVDDLKKWSGEQSLLQLYVTEIKNIGKGVAYKIESSALLQLHQTMQRRWSQWLTPQDKQKLWPHVTVQNKVPPERAKETLQLLQESFQPFVAAGIGFRLWSYEGGPWKALQMFSFNP